MRVRVWLSVGEGVGKDVCEGVCVMSMLPGLRCVGSVWVWM